MKNFFTKLTSVVLVFAFLTGFKAAASDIAATDITGHWAEATLRKAVSDSLIEGYDGKLFPDTPITGAEIVTILDRVMSAEAMADISNITDVTKNDWYYDEAAKAVALGIIQPIDGRLNLSGPLTRMRTFAIVAAAFQLIPASPDTSTLSRFSDAGQLSGAYRLAAAALVSGGYIQGYNGALHITDSITRAEFLTVLYNIAANYTGTASVSASLTGGTVISADASLTGGSYTAPLYFNRSVSRVYLQQVFAPSVVLRSEALNALSLSGCTIDRLVLAAGGSVSVLPDNSNSVKTAVVGAGTGNLTLGGSITDVEVTGDGRTVVIAGPIRQLVISGSSNTIIVNAGVSVGMLKVLETGTGNKITLNGDAVSCELYGPQTVLDGAGSVQDLADNAAGSLITVAAVNTTVDSTYGLNGVQLTLTAPDTLLPYDSLNASVSISAPSGSKSCQGAWYIDDILVSKNAVSLGQTKTVSLNYNVKYRGDVPKPATLTFVLTYVDPNGIYHEARVYKSLTLESPDKVSAAEALSLVKTGYKGNFTLNWAKGNDYAGAVKESWINAKGYSSKTSYLIWVSIAYQRVNVFTGSAGNWVLDRTFIVGTGAPGYDTPTGVTRIIARNAKGWTTAEYTVKPVINFYNYAYGFHSRLYKPNTTTILDSRIGFPVSHGCIRMYDEDVSWLWNNIPVGTAVIIY